MCLDMDAQIAQLVEQETENLCVVGSIPTLGTICKLFMANSEKNCEALDVGASCFVFASAGSGKTRVLVDRYVKTLFQGIDAKDVLCITYSNDAVCEIEERISNKLLELYLNKDNFTARYLNETLGITNVSEKDVVKASELFFKFQNILSQTKIMTIHSLCQLLLLQFPLETGIAPNFNILDDAASKKLIRQAKDTCLNTLSEEVIKKLSETMSLKTFEDFIDNVYQYLPQFADFFCKYKTLSEYKNKVSNFFNISHYGDDTLQEFSLEQKDFIAKRFANANLEEKYLTQNGTLRKKIPYADEVISHQIAAVVYENYIRKNKSRTLEKTCSYLHLVEQIIEEYNRLKDEKNVLNFSDILFKTKYLLTESCAKEFVTSKICSQIKAIMIDEAQDLSPLQWELVRIFADDIFSNPHSEKAIFVVGDVKQSIYRFQGADCNLFIEFCEKTKDIFRKFNRKLKIISLDKNYRSLPKILEAVDKTFEGDVSQNLLGRTMKYHKHIPFREDANGVIEIIHINTSTEQQAQEIAKNIAELMTENSLILTRNRDDLSENVVKNLENLGVEVAPSDRIKLSDSSLVSDLLAMTDICISQENDYAMYCILKSPYIFEKPLTNADLYKVCHNRTCSVFENLRTYFFEKYMYLDKIISQYEENELRKFFYSLTTKLHNISSNEKYILGGFMDEVTKFSKNSENIPEFLTHFRTSDIEIINQKPSKKIIRLSTIHGSKGLEADTVFLLDFNLTADKSKINFLFSDDFFFIKPPRKQSFPEIEQLAEKEYASETQELYRLLYVALTRARDNLYIFSYGKTASSLIKSKCFEAGIR